MLSLLVNEREQVFPKAGHFAALAQQTGMINFSNTGALDLSLPASTGASQSEGKARSAALQPQMTLSLPGEQDGLPPVPPSKSPIIRYGASSSTPPSVGLRVPLSTLDTNWTSLSSSTGAASPASAGARKSNGSIPGYRASWHVVDLPNTSFMDDTNTSGGSRTSGNGTQKNSMDGGDTSDEGHSNTPIARKFLHQRASIGSLLERSIVLPGQSSPSPSVSSRRSVSSGASIQNGGSGVLTRTPTLTGRSPSPFFSSGAPPAALGFIATHSRKRSSASSFSSIVSNSAAGGLNSASAISENARAPWKPRKPSPAQHENVRQVMKQQQDEEEELSNSDTNTSICSSTSSAQTPKDQDDIDQVISSSGNLSIQEKTDLDAEENDTVDTTFDSRRATITVDSFNSATFARKGNGRYANNDEMKRKRGSVMLMNMPSFS
jgi:hypothetical protein